MAASTARSAQELAQQMQAEHLRWFVRAVCPEPSPALQHIHGLSLLFHWQRHNGELGTDAWMAHMRMYSTAKRLTILCHGEGVLFFPLRGWDLSERVYYPATLRSMNHLHIWVRLFDQEFLGSLLPERGYTRVKSVGVVNSWRDEETQMVIELHSALSEPGEASFDWRMLWSHAEKWRFDNYEIWRLSAEDLWIYTAWNYARRAGQQRKLLWLLDLHLLCCRITLNWTVVSERANTFHVGQAVRVALWELQRYGLNMPEDAPEVFLPPWFRPERWATHLEGEWRQNLYHLWVIEGAKARGKMLLNQINAPTVK